MQDQRPTHLDWFSGGGGMSLAFEAAGFRTVGFAEVEPYASGVLRRHWPRIPNYGDFRNTPRRYVDVVTAGIPCQPASVSGQMLGFNDERWLWADAIELLGRLQPRAALFENVANLLNVNSGEAFNRILSRLHEIGYDAIWETVPACAFGAWHERERIYIIAYSAALDGVTRDLLEESKERGPQMESGGLPWMAMASGWTAGSAWFEREPRLVRLVDGIPNRTHRLELSGNAVVPQAIYPFAKAIYKIIHKPPPPT